MVTATQVHDAAKTILGAAATAPDPALTERDLLALVLEFANDGRLTGPLLRAPGLRFLVPLVRSPDGRLRIPEGGAPADFAPTHADVAPTPELIGLREQLKEDLVAAMGDGLTAAAAKRLKSAAAQMVATPTYEIERRNEERRLRARWHYMPMSLEAILAYAVLLLRDTDRALGADLKRCRLERCQRFFFSSDRSQARRGRPSELFCEKAHMLEAHKETGAERTRRWRQRAAAKHK